MDTTPNRPDRKAPLGHPWTGRFADSRGRRTVGFVLMASFPLFAFAFYLGPAFTLPFAWIPLIFTLTWSPSALIS